MSKKDNGIYIGYADDIKRRHKEHMAGQAKSTKNRRPLELIYFEGYKDKRKALLREKYLKTGWGRNYLAKILSDK